jgi:hypothetical protein
VKKLIGAFLLLQAASPTACADETCGPLFTVERSVNACAEVLTEIDGRNAVLSRVFVSATRGLFPSVAYALSRSSSPFSGPDLAARRDFT